MTRATDFATMLANYGTPDLVDLTPTPLVNIGDVGPWVRVPMGGNPGFVHVEHDNSAAVADCRCDYANSTTYGTYVPNVWTSQNLTGSLTGDGFVPMRGGGWIRLRLGANHINGTVVTGQLSWS